MARTVTRAYVVNRNDGQPDDVIVIGTGNAIVVGGQGDDEISGGSGSSVIIGDSGRIVAATSNLNRFGGLRRVLPVTHWTPTDLADEAVKRGIVTRISARTIASCAACSSSEQATTIVRSIVARTPYASHTVRRMV